jgi:hypothetical protein
MWKWDVLPIAIQSTSTQHNHPKEDQHIAVLFIPYNDKTQILFF